MDIMNGVVRTVPESMLTCRCLRRLSEPCEALHVDRGWRQLGRCAVTAAQRLCPGGVLHGGLHRDHSLRGTQRGHGPRAIDQ